MLVHGKCASLSLRRRYSQSRRPRTNRHRHQLATISPKRNDARQDVRGGATTFATTTMRTNEYPLRTKLLAWASLTSIQIIASTILKVANQNGQYTFSPQSSLTMSEAIKCVLSFLYLFQETNSLRCTKRALVEQSSLRLTFHMFALAAIYCVNNGIMFYLFARADPGSITLVKSGATIVSALMMYHRGFRLSIVRWAVIIVQMLGLIIAQYDNCLQKTHLAPLIYVILLISLFNSSLANVWNEHVIKSFEGSTIATKNIYLYLFGVIFNFSIFVSQANDAPGFFQGYTWAGVGVVISNAFMGIAINLVYKYADALVKNIATTSTTVVLVMLSGGFFGGRSDVMVFIGCGVVVVGTYLYFAIGSREEEMQEMRKQMESEEMAR